LIFGNKQTIEFRIHTPTTNFRKITWFILLNSVIVNFVKANQNNILKNKDWIYSLGSLHDFLSSNMSLLIRSKNERIYSDFFNYYENRRHQIFLNNKNSKIFENDEYIRCNFDIIERKPSESLNHNPTNSIINSRRKGSTLKSTIEEIAEYMIDIEPFVPSSTTNKIVIDEIKKDYYSYVVD